MNFNTVNRALSIRNDMWYVWALSGKTPAIFGIFMKNGKFRAGSSKTHQSRNNWIPIELVGDLWPGYKSTMFIRKMNDMRKDANMLEKEYAEDISMFFRRFIRHGMFFPIWETLVVAPNGWAMMGDWFF